MCKSAVLGLALLLAGFNTVGTVLPEDYQWTLNGTTALEPPFIYSESGPYRGYCVDVIDAISEHIGFNYSLRQSPDGKIGTVNRLNGVFGELTGGHSEFAIGGISRNWLNDVSRAYNMGVLFTKPILVSTLNVLLSKKLLEKLEKKKLDQISKTNNTDVVQTMVNIEDLFNFPQLTRLVFKDSAVNEFYANIYPKDLSSLTIVEKSALFGYGLDRLRDQDYILIDESKFNDYFADQDCHYTLIDAKQRFDDEMVNVRLDATTMAPVRKEELFRNEIVIALSRNFVLDQQKKTKMNWLDEFNNVIEEMNTSGKLLELQNKHWRTRCRMVIGQNNSVDFTPRRILLLMIFIVATVTNL